MRSRDLSSWMWGDALSLLERAERLHRQFCNTGINSDLAEAQCWEPPIDVLEDHEELVVHIALPGVPASDVVVHFAPGGITVSGLRRLPAKQASRIHRVEIPYGRFERRIPLPLHALEPQTPGMADGCLVLRFRKLKENL